MRYELYVIPTDAADVKAIVAQKASVARVPLAPNLIILQQFSIVLISLKNFLDSCQKPPITMNDILAENGTIAVDADIIVDVQGDEPLIYPETIDTLVSNFKLSSFDIMLPYIEINDTNNVNIVKISTVGKKIIYMSRMDIPCPFSQDRKLKKHLSIIAFTVSALRKYSHMKKSELEKIESIELLRALESGLEIGTFQESKESFSVDVIEDYHRANRYMRDDKVYKRYRLVQ